MQTNQTIVDRVQAVTSEIIETQLKRHNHILPPNISFYEWMSTPADPFEVGPLNIYRLRNVSILSNRRLQLCCHPTHFPIEEASINPPYVRSVYRLRLKDESLRPSRMAKNEVQENCYLVPGWAPFEWGHTVVEFIPRILLLVGQIVNQPDKPVYISALTPEYIRSIFSLLLPHGTIIKYFDDNCITNFKDAVVPQYTQYLDYTSGSKGYHPAIKRLIQILIKSTLDNCRNCNTQVDGARKIYISRKHDSNYVPLNPDRRILNEDQVIDVFTRHGFSIIRMEDFDFAEKIVLLNQSKVVAGGAGSGLNNLLFSMQEPTVIQIGMGMNHVQAHISLLMKQRHFELPTYADSDCSQLLENIAGTKQHANIKTLERVLESYID